MSWERDLGEPIPWAVPGALATFKASFPKGAIQNSQMCLILTHPVATDSGRYVLVLFADGWAQEIWTTKLRPFVPCPESEPHGT